MLTINFLSNDIKALPLSTTIAEVKQLFNELIFTHLPVVENGNLYGLIAERDLPSIDANLTLKDVQYVFQSFFSFNDATWFDLLKIFAYEEANIIPILNQKKEYIGYYELNDILHIFNSTPFLQEEGTILVLSKLVSDYSLSEVAQIIESNDAKLLGVFVSKTEGDIVELTLKVYSDNINDVIHSFRRYNYGIILGINEDEYLSDLKSRSEYLQKYLNI